MVYFLSAWEFSQEVFLFFMSDFTRVLATLENAFLLEMMVEYQFKECLPYMGISI